MNAIKNKKIKLFVLTHNRPKILTHCLSFLMNNQVDKEIVIVIDGNNEEVLKVAKEFSQIKSNTPISYITNPRTNGSIISFAYNYIYNCDSDIVGIIEGDYIYRSQYLEEISDVFDEYHETLSICGYHHPDTRNMKLCLEDFSNLTKKFFGRDIENREYMYKPFSALINNKKYSLQGVSNHTISHFINVPIFKKVFENEIENLIIHTSDNLSPVGLCDARISSTYQIFWENWAKKQNLDLSKNFPILDICDFSIANHFGGGGTSVSQGSDGDLIGWVSSPTWVNPLLILDRNKTL